MFEISKKKYQIFVFIYFSSNMIGVFSHNTFIPTEGYRIFSYLFIWIFAIWITIISIPNVKENLKKDFLGKYVSIEIFSLMSVVVYAHFNALLLFQFVPLITKYIHTSERIMNYPVNDKVTRHKRAFLACDQYIQLDHSFYYGHLCVTKQYYDSKRDHDIFNNEWDSVKVIEKRNILGNYIVSYY
jgi:hypothetical protein